MEKKFAAQLELFDSMSRRTAAFEGELGSELSIYACGVTPYAAAHVGHARSFAVFDLLERTARLAGFKPVLARNITDIDDKILAAAKASGEHWKALAERNAARNRALMEATGFSVPIEPRASEHIPEIVAMVERLFEKDLAYRGADGGVWYRVSAFEGNLLTVHAEGALLSEAGAGRVDDSGKEDPRDFALWKPAGEGEPGWESPWGRGRPGWHAECSAMIGALFGGRVDVHGGGSDLRFPHHQAEIMQSEPVWGGPLAKVWAHNGSVLSEGAKMSKSLGNYVEWSAALDRAEAAAPGHGGDALKWALLSAHWRKPFDWNPESLGRAAEDLADLGRRLAEGSEPEAQAAARSQVRAILSANMNTPRLFAWFREQRGGPLRTASARAVKEALGLRIEGPIRAAAPDPETAALVETLTARRLKARAEKDWALADELRGRLRDLGVEASDAKA